MGFRVPSSIARRRSARLLVSILVVEQDLSSNFKPSSGSSSSSKVYSGAQMPLSPFETFIFKTQTPLLMLSAICVLKNS
ncbi:hypothetical protein L917_12599 [Phytophthora nicotianae]|uniref:Uncharacterized protein n=1 Tax=Phytophthora nicotianae TaxID=4792 RepID=W2KVA8_PHYNI|nr:hypothetical protein L917_12599 [Phytophthora nicotianae]